MIVDSVSLHPTPSHLKTFKISDLSPGLSEAHAPLERDHDRSPETLKPIDAESTVTRDIEGVNCIPALPQTTMEKLVENVSLVNMNIAGTPTATPVTPKKTKCKKKVVKPDGFGIFRQDLEEVDESMHTLSTRVATFFDPCRSAVLGPVHVVYGGKERVRARNR